MKKYNLIITALILTTLFLLTARVVISNRMSTSGFALGEVNKEISFYKTQNAILSEHYLASSSFTNLASVAAKLGFVEGKSNFVLTNSLPLAVKR